MYLDASLKALGGVLRKLAYTVQLAKLSVQHTYNIAQYEMLNILVAIQHWASSLKGTRTYSL